MNNNAISTDVKLGVGRKTYLDAFLGWVMHFDNQLSRYLSPLLADARLSVIVPVYNKETNLPLLRQRLTAVLEGLVGDAWARDYIEHQ